MRRAARESLAQQFARALKAVLTDETLRTDRLPAPPVEPHPHDVELLARARRQIPEALQRFRKTKLVPLEWLTS